MKGCFVLMVRNSKIAKTSQLVQHTNCVYYGADLISMNPDCHGFYPKVTICIVAKSSVPNNKLLLVSTS